MLDRLGVELGKAPVSHFIGNSILILYQEAYTHHSRFKASAVTLDDNLASLTSTINNMAGLVAQFGIVSHVRRKVFSNPEVLEDRYYTPVLSYEIFGFRFSSPPVYGFGIQDSFLSPA